MPVLPTTPLRPDQIRFHDSSVPPVQAGLHTITATLTVANADKSIVYDNTLSHTQKLRVAGPRFALKPNDVYAVYPPANSQGEFSTTFPHVVLARCTLPWECQMGGRADTSLPWMTLLLFDEDELIAPTGSRSETRVSTGKVSERIVAEPKAFVQHFQPDLDAGEGDTNCSTIDIPVSVFKAIAPELGELPYLAHVRQVNTAHKELLGPDQDGWFSVVMGNRLPNSTGRNIVHLVSLEGLANYLSGSKTPGSFDGFTTVRLVSLASWSFTCVESTGSFEHLMETVAENSGLLRMPSGPPGKQDPISVEQLLSDALAKGYVILDYLTRDGESDAACDRGPLVPFAPRHGASAVKQDASAAPEIPPQGIIRTADQAMIYDPQTGLSDQSYAVAWQIGRLLALADGGFSLALLNWRRQSYRQINLLDERQRLSQDYGQTLRSLAAGDETTAAPLDPAELMRHNRAARWATSFLKTQLGPVIAPAGPDAEPLIRAADPSGLRRPEPLPGLLSAAEVDDILASGLQPVQRLFARLSGSSGKEGQP